jgi:hypothetical protein
MRGWLAVALAAAFLFAALVPGQTAENPGKKKAADIVKVGGSVMVTESTTVGDAVAVGGSVTVNGEALGDIVAVGGSVILGPRAVARGDVVAIGGKVEKTQGCFTEGDVVEVNLPPIADAMKPGGLLKLAGVFAFIGAAVAFLWFLAMLALALLFVALAPGIFEPVARKAGETPLACGLWGLLGVILVVPVGLFLLVSIIGIPLIPIELVFVGCVSFAGCIGVGLCLGRYVATRLGKPALGTVPATLLGLIIVWAVGMIPIVGWVVKAGAGLVGFGAALMALRALRQR